MPIMKPRGAKKSPAQEPESPAPAERPAPSAEPAPSSGASAADPAEFDRIAEEVGADAGPPLGAGPLPDDEVAERIETLAAVAEGGGLDELDAEDVADLLTLVFGLVADSRGRHWELSAGKERERIAKWVHRVVQKYGLGWFKRWLPEVLSATLLALAVSRRVQVDRELAAKRAPAGPPAEGAA